MRSTVPRLVLDAAALALVPVRVLVLDPVRPQVVGSPGFPILVLLGPPGRGLRWRGNPFRQKWKRNWAGFLILDEFQPVG